MPTLTKDPTKDEQSQNKTPGTNTEKEAADKAAKEAAEQKKADKVIADKKEADKKLADLKKKDEEKTKKENVILKSSREKVLSERSYVPKPGTGKSFHVELENPLHGKTGEKVSQPTVQIIDAKFLIHWINNAARLGLAFAMKHDASVFWPDLKGSIKKALIGYVEHININTFKYGAQTLVQEASPINNMLLKAYRNRAKAIKESVKKKEEKPSFID